MKNPLKSLRYHFSLQSAIDEGFAYKRKHPLKLSEKQRKKLMEESALETPRSKIRSIMGVLKPYLALSSPKEKIFAYSLITFAIGLNKFSIDMTVDFGNWISGLTNTVVQMAQIIAGARPEIIPEIIDNYPALQEVLANDQVLKEILLRYPDTTQILQDPQFHNLLSKAPDLTEVLQKNPTMEQVFMQYPGFAEEVADNPALLDQLGNFREELSGELKKLPKFVKAGKDLLYLCGGAFVENTCNFASTAFNSAANNVSEWGEAVRQSFNRLWNSKDLVTIALKFTAAAIASYKSAQYLILRWRAWSTGYYTSKWTENKSFVRIKSVFNNIDNPGQRIQEDPQKYSAASISLFTGFASALMTLQAFGGMLWGMGPVAGVPGGFFWVGAAYAATLLGLTTAAGYQLPNIYRNRQRVEANLRSATDNIHNNAEQIGLTNSEEVERDLVKKRVTPVMKNTLRDIKANVRLILIDATMGNVSIPLPYIVAAFTAVAAGTATMGTVTTLNYAFNRVNSSLSFIVNRFEQISNYIATAQRIHALDLACDASYVIDQEKREASKKVSLDLPEPASEQNNAPPPDTLAM
jgi:putative ATP-binding cassette transporter